MLISILIRPYLILLSVCSGRNQCLLASNVHAFPSTQLVRMNVIKVRDVAPSSSSSTSLRDSFGGLVHLRSTVIHFYR